jgi:hypothetical protein
MFESGILKDLLDHSLAPTTITFNSDEGHAAVSSNSIDPFGSHQFSVLKMEVRPKRGNVDLTQACQIFFWLSLTIWMVLPANANNI